MRSLFKRKPKREAQGVIERFGVHFGQAEIDGYCFKLRGDSAIYLILRETQRVDRRGAGLTDAGDAVRFTHDINGVVNLSDFENLTFPSLTCDQ